MKIFTLTSIAGVGFSYPPGKVVDYADDKEAQRMIDAGNARKPTPAELAVAGERAKAAEAEKKAADEATAAVAKTVAASNKKRADDAAKGFEKKRGRPPGAKTKTSKSKKK